MLLSMFILVLQGTVMAQDSLFTIQGVVADSGSGERIPYANVMLAEGKIGTVTDRNGAFVMRNLSRRELIIRISAVGYESKSFTLHPGTEDVLRLRFLLKESPPTLREVTIFGDSAGMRYLAPGTTIISPADAKSNVSFFKNDLVHYVTRLPGVVTLSGLASRYYVRGGSADQNLLTLDGIRIYNFAHAFGLFSFLDPKIVKTATFLAGNFVAEYGNRLSSVMDVRTVDGDRSRITGEGSVDLFTSDLKISGPLTLSHEGTSSFVAFYRFPMSKNIIKKFYSRDDPFDFYDGFVKIGSDIGSVGRVSAEAFAIGDVVQSSGYFNPDFSWDQRAAAVSGSFFFGDKHVVNFSISYSRYKTEQSLKTLEAFQYPEKCEVTEPSITADATYFTDSGDQLNLGLFFGFPNYFNYFTNAYGNIIETSTLIVEPQFWGSYHWQIGTKLVVVPGLRFDLASIAHLSSGAVGYLADPRLSVFYKVNDRIVLNAGLGRYHQRLINMNDENEIYTPFDLIVPLPDDIDQEVAWDYTLGVAAAPSVLTTVKGAIYLKDFMRLVDINREKIYAYQPDFVSGRGLSYGAEVSFRYETEALYGDINYSYGRVTRNFEGVEFIPRYDLRHQVNSSAGFRPFAGVWLRAFWRITSGLPYTPLAGFFGEPLMTPWDPTSSRNGWIARNVKFGHVNSARFPGYQSLDVSAEYEIDILDKSLTLQIAVINLYNRRNVYYLNNVTLDVEYQLPRMADFSISWKF